jgi:hypothetical protein
MTSRRARRGSRKSPKPARRGSALLHAKPQHDFPPDRQTYPACRPRRPWHRRPPSIRLTLDRLIPTPRAMSACFASGFARPISTDRFALFWRQPVRAHSLAAGCQCDVPPIGDAPHRRIIVMMAHLLLCGAGCGAHGAIAV